jgi:hypothetical protein
MEKTFSSLKPLIDVDGRSKALFDVNGAMLIEKYCDTCAEKEAK